MRRDQRGTAIVEFVWLGLLLLVPLLYVVLAVFDTQRASYAASAAARSATRAFVTAPDQSVARVRAEAAARLAFADQGIDGAAFTLTITCRPEPDRCLVPGSVVSAEVRSAAELPLMPSALGEDVPRIAVAAIHRSPYGTFREARP
jgi:Flp pilus assembly protein TadG